MNAMSSPALVFSVLMATTINCQPQSSHQDKSSISVTAICPADSKIPANFSTGTMNWSADGKQIQMHIKRVALDQGKPTDKVLASVDSKYTFLSKTCQQ